MPSNEPSSSPNRTAFAMLPTPDCSGSRFSGMRPFCTSQPRNSRMCPAMSFEVRRADALASADQWNGPAIGRRLQTVVNVVHAFQGSRLPGVDFENHAIGLVDPGLVVADRGTRDQAAVLKHGGDFDERDIELAEEPILHELGDMAEVDVHVVHLAGVDALAGLGIGLVGKAKMDTTCHGERSVKFWAGGGAGKNADLEFLAAEVGVRNVASQFNGNGLGISGAGKSAHADLVAGMNESSSFLGAHDLLRQLGVQNPRGS